jgi:hypothetical protein
MGAGAVAATDFGKRPLHRRFARLLLPRCVFRMRRDAGGAFTSASDRRYGRGGSTSRRMVMFTRVRGFFVAVAIGALLLGHAAPATASNIDDDFSRVHDVPILLDAMVMRPVGLAVTAVGAALAPLPMVIVGITHPPDVLKPFDILVMAPARFTFADPIGQH